MTPKVLTAAGAVSCGQDGTVTLTASQQVLIVGGTPALVPDDLSGASVVGCTTVPDSSKGLKACSSTTAPTAGAAALLVAGGKPVLLETAAGLTDGTAPNPVAYSTSDAGQSLLVAT